MSAHWLCAPADPQCAGELAGGTEEAPPVPLRFSQQANVSTLGSAPRVHQNWCEERQDARENESGLRLAAQLGRQTL